MIGQFIIALGICLYFPAITGERENRAAYPKATGHGVEDSILWRLMLRSSGSFLNF